MLRETRLKHDMLTLPVGCKPVFQQCEVLSLFSVLGSWEAGNVSCPLSYQHRAHIMYSFLWVQSMRHVHFLLVKGTYHVNFSLTTGHASCTLSSQNRTHVRSIYSTGTAIVHSLSWLMFIYLSNADSWVSWGVRVCEWFPAC